MADFVIKNGKLIKYKGDGGGVVIPEGVTVIGTKAFDECEDLEVVIIPEGVVAIEESAFEDCEQLTGVILPESLLEIGEKAFEDCKSLERVELPSNLRVIGKEAFSDCDNLRGIVLPYRNVKIAADQLDCVEITAHNLAALYVFQRTKAAQRIFDEHAEKFNENELASELLAALDGHETMRRCEKVAVYLNAVKRLSKKNRTYGEEVFSRVSAQHLLT